MSLALSPADKAKFAAARRSVDFIEDGMRVGLGTGSTAAWMVRCLGDRVRGEGLKVTGVATSDRTAELAISEGIRVVTLEEAGWLDLTIDGADEFDPELNLIKGGGGALLREKIVAAASARMIVIADDGKLVQTLGRFPLPIEVVPFGLEATRRAVTAAIAASGAAGKLVLRQRADGTTLVTDGGHYILDAHLGTIERPELLAQALNIVPGVVEHGLFIGLASGAILAGADGLKLLGSIE